MSLEKYIDRIMRIVYIDRNNRITERMIHSQSVRGGLVRAYCLTSGRPRVFPVHNVPAAEAAVGHHAV